MKQTNIAVISTKPCNKLTLTKRFYLLFTEPIHKKHFLIKRFSREVTKSSVCVTVFSARKSQTMAGLQSQQ